MSQTNNTPAGPDRGSIATGQHTPERDGESAAGNGRVVDGAPAESPAEESASAEGSTVTGAVGASEASAPESDEPREPDATATAKLRVPASAQAKSSGNGAKDAKPAAADAAPAAPTLDPLPAPAVPAPGPAAAQPPPWRRMPGHEVREAPLASDEAGLLDEGPTAFLEAPRFAPPAPTKDGEAAAVETGGWARATTRSRPPRQAALQLRRLDPWSVLKLALVLAVVLFFIWLVAVGVLYGVLDGMGVWDRLNGTYADLVSGEAQTGSALISAGRVFGLAAVIGAINSLLFAVAVTVGAFVYNVSADLVGGIEVTLSERD
ncbi:MAG TPA: DUF3566 domain-containing protein [Micromonosporaceae bacterium]|nr:DUF3566 domain-containing protein [Micromonosporaceae bacterium]